MIVNNPNDLANYIRSQREDSRQSQSDIADAVGIKQTTVSSFELKPNGTKLETLFRLLAAMELEIDIRPRNEKDCSEDWKEEW